MSSVYDDPRAEQTKRENLKNTSRDWCLYTWDSRGKLTSEDDGTVSINKDTIAATLKEYEIKESKRPHRIKIYDEFIANGIAPPNHYILISAYNSFIKTPKETMMKIIKILESRNIECMLTTNGAPAINNAKENEHITKTLDEKLKHPISIKL